MNQELPRFHLRYEDVTQDGRVQLGALQAALRVIWRRPSLGEQIRRALAAKGIMPIISRYEIEGTPGPFAVEGPVEVEGGYELAHSVDDDGNVARVLLDMRMDLWANKGRTFMPAPPDAGARALVGRLSVEYVFTRPFAPPGERRVLALPVDGVDVVPPKQRAWKPPLANLRPPEGARALESDFSHDGQGVVLGIAHTDSSQHVNSLVYPRLFEQAALERSVALGRSAKVLARKLDIAYRSPSFAGERLRIALRAFEHEGRLVCVGAFLGEGEKELERARVYAQMAFE